jgi:hypothetical protein
VTMDTVGLIAVAEIVIVVVVVAVVQDISVT